MPTLTVKQDTLLKSHPIDSHSPSLPIGFQAIAIKSGTKLDYNWLKAIDGHYFFELTEQKEGRFNWYLFRDHAELPIMDVTAEFKLKLARTPQLINGTLTFFRGDDPVLEVVATSGAPGFQYFGAWTIRRRGCIPPARDWKISTNGYYLPTKGIEGQFYHITPDPRSGRSELGLHRDANAPGSAGCIVVRDSDVFNRRVVPFIDGLEKTQKQINLAVVYI